MVVYFISQTIKPDILHPELFKTGQITPSSGFEHDFATVARFCLFLFISPKSSKNHSKSYKSHKIENLILLDST